MSVAVGSQRLMALERANEAKRTVAATKERVASLGKEDGARFVADVLERAPSSFGAIRMAALLNSIPRVGDSTTRSVLVRAKVDQWKRARSLSADEAVRVAEQLRLLADGRRRPYVQASKSRCACGEVLRWPTGQCGFCAAEARETAR